MINEASQGNKIKANNQNAQLKALNNSESKKGGAYQKQLAQQQLLDSHT
jgi:hypothetical protein